MKLDKLLCVLILAFLSFPSPSMAAGSDITWTRQTSPGCLGALSFSCGSRGFYSVSESSSKGGEAIDGPLAKAACRPAASGHESAPVYAGTALPPDGPIPCDGGTCLAASPGDDPWVAVVDWGQWHGEAVSWLIGEISGPAVDVVLFPLDGGAMAGVSPSATDLQVLEQLCAVLEEAEAGAPPVAVNMSFGRPPSTVPCGLQSTLACEIDAVLQDLYDEGSWLVAAAGNHQTPLYPGTHAKVMSVGSLDIETYRRTYQAEGSWESPPADALMPSAALCLADGAGAWGPPPGSSFAAALMTSWLTASGLPLMDPGIGGWAPMRQHFEPQPYFLLSHSLGHLPSTQVSAIDDLLTALLARDVGGCHPMNFFASTVAVPAVPLAGAPVAEPLVNYRPQMNGPTPDPDPCLPCTGGWDDGPGGGGLTAPGGGGLTAPGGGGLTAPGGGGLTAPGSGGLTAPGGGGLTAPGSEKALFGQQRLAVSFMDSTGVPDGLELVDVLLVRSRDELYFEIDLPPSEHAALIADIASGAVSALAFDGVQPHLALDDSVSVVYLFEPAEGDSASLLETKLLEKELLEKELVSTIDPRYWSSTPIYALDLQWPTVPQ